MDEYQIWVIRNNMPRSALKTLSNRTIVQGIQEARSVAKKIKSQYPKDRVVYFASNDINEV